MEFHLPYFALRKYPQPNSSHKKMSTHGLRKWEYISLIDEEISVLGGQELYRLHEAQASLCVYGPDEWQWTACAFLDEAHRSGNLYDYGETRDGDGKDGEGEEDEENGEDETAVLDEKPVDVDEDPIATGLYASIPIWRPRQYFVFAFEVNIRETSLEWRELVHKLEYDINASVCIST